MNQFPNIKCVLQSTITDLQKKLTVQVIIQFSFLQDNNNGARYRENCFFSTRHFSSFPGYNQITCSAEARGY
jgi:hypothetical protein